MPMSEEAQDRSKRLKKMAVDAMTQYSADLAAGGEPVCPSWPMELLSLVADYDRILHTIGRQNMQMVNVVDLNNGKCTASVIHRVAS